jgi:hypothetical protein
MAQTLNIAHSGPDANNAFSDQDATVVERYLGLG